MAASKSNFEGTIAVTAGGTVAAGDIGFLGDAFGMYMKAAVLNDIVPFLIQGYIKDAPKVGSQAWAVGDLLYWDATNTRFTKTLQNGTPPRGVAAAIAGSGAGVTTGDVVINPALGLGGYKMARGVATTVAASDTVATGLATVVAVVVSMGDDPGSDPISCSATIGDQAGTPAAGSFLLKTWKPTDATHPALIAATTFTKKVNWIAIGT